MGILDETRFVERLQFFDGQRLFASDLQGIEAFHREMRWLHNRSLHQAGIGNGFAVSGERDAREVRIGPGYALDALGREIVLTREQVEPVPPVAAETDGQSVFFDLVVSYPDDASLETTETRQGICLPRGVVRRREEPVLCWVRLERGANDVLQAVDPKLRRQIQDGLRVVLTRVEVIDCRLRRTISLAERRSARPSCQPYLACGTDQAPPKITLFSNYGYLFLLSWHVDTSSAGFLTTPCYSVRLDGPRLDQYSDEGSTRTRYFLRDGAPQILEPRPESFDVEVVVEYFDLLESNSSGVLNDWRVVWMGVE